MKASRLAARLVNHAAAGGQPYRRFARRRLRRRRLRAGGRLWLHRMAALVLCQLACIRKRLCSNSNESARK